MEKQKFLAYFFNTFKESKWLLLRYLIVGISLIIISIISNLLSLENLTYFNAMITLCYLGEMIAFGFSEGFGIYINQHINEPDRAKKYARIGLYFTTITILILVIVFAMFPSFILKTILNLNFNPNLIFYYLMLAVIVVMTVFAYFNHILKKVGEFKYQLIASFIQVGLLTISFALLLLFDTLMLIPIAIIYLCSHLFCIYISHSLLLNNKNFSINLLKLEKLSLSKQEFWIILQRASAELVWDIGYVFISLFILKVDVILYNQYCYFENSLDILNGLFYAFASVISIKICRCIGEERKEEAKMHAKFALHSTIIIWLIFTALSLLLFIPLKHGMNIELQASAFIGILLYCVVTLFRFIEYALGTYILGQSEFFSKAGLILETIFMIFWIVLYAIGNLIPANIYIIYGLIATQNLIKIIVSIIYYKNDKWLEKSE